MNIRRRMKKRTIRAIINGFRRKRRLWVLPQKITIEIPILHSDDTVTADEFNKNFEPITEPASPERATIYINGKPVDWIG